MPPSFVSVDKGFSADLTGELWIAVGEDVGLEGVHVGKLLLVAHRAAVAVGRAVLVDQVVDVEQDAHDFLVAQLALPPLGVQRARRARLHVLFQNGLVVVVTPQMNLQQPLQVKAVRTSNTVVLLLF